MGFSSSAYSGSLLLSEQLKTKFGVSDLDALVEKLAVKTSFKYSHWISGMESQVVNASLQINVNDGWVNFFDSSDREDLQWVKTRYGNRRLPFPAILQNNPKAFLYGTPADLEFSLEPPTNSILRQKVCFGLAHTQDSLTFSSFDSFVVENSPEVQSLLLIGGFANPNRLYSKPKSNNLELTIDTGKFLAVGRNFFDDANNPHEITLTGGDLTWDRVTPTGTTIAANENQLNFTQYWNEADGVLATPTGDNDPMVLYHYVTPKNKHYMVVGNAFYTSMGVARDLWEQENHVTPAFIKNNALLLEAIIGRKDATNASNLNQILIKPYKT